MRPAPTFRSLTLVESLGVFGMAVLLQAAAGALYFTFPPAYLKEAAAISATSPGMPAADRTAAMDKWLSEGASRSVVDAFTEHALSTAVLTVLFLFFATILSAALRKGSLAGVWAIVPVLAASAIVPAVFHSLRLALAMILDRDPGAFTFAFGLAGPYSTLGRIEIGIAWRWALAGCGLGVVLGRNPLWFAIGAAMIGVLAMSR